MDTTFLMVLVLTSLSIVVFAYAGYPVLVWIASRMFGRAPQRPEIEEDQLPTLSLLIAAYNEEAEIQQRLENALEMDYPDAKLEIVVASDGSTDRTNDIVRSYEKYGVKLLAYPRRRGKATVLNESIPKLRGEIVMLSDANTFAHADAAQRLAAWFQDSDIGVVCGRLILTDSSTGQNVDSLYWKYETFLKKCESRLGALLGSNGGIYAIRRSLFQGIPANTIIDDFVIPLLAAKHSGSRLVYDPEAIALEETPPRLATEFHRRARIGAGGFQSIPLLACLLNPAYGWISLTFACHKILRWLCPFAMIIAFIANALVFDRFLFQYLFIAQAAFYGVSLAASHLPVRPRIMRYPRLTTMFTMMNAALLVGFFRCLCGEQSAAWKRTARARESAMAGVGPSSDLGLPNGSMGKISAPAATREDG
jgi:cellulose synthase/poly-beta-1,6-N-acetylglucosamine synthase-like glycosyltransferase